MIKKDKKNLGLTIIEALVSTVVVGIGFIAVFQMTNFSVRSIDTSSERTKANYLVSMMAEDVLGHSRTVHGVNTLTGDYAVDIDGSIQVEGVKVPTARLFTDHLAAVEFRVDGCDGPAVVAGDTDTAGITIDSETPVPIYSGPNQQGVKVASYDGATPNGKLKSETKNEYLL